MSKDFFEVPNNVNRRKAVLNVGRDTYSPLSEVEGKQPYYTYQGIGKTKSIIKTDLVVHQSVQVQHNSIDVSHSAPA